MSISFSPQFSINLSIAFPINLHNRDVDDRLKWSSGPYREKVYDCIAENYLSYGLRPCVSVIPGFFIFRGKNSHLTMHLQSIGIQNASVSFRHIFTTESVFAENFQEFFKAINQNWKISSEFWFLIKTNHCIFCKKCFL